MTTHLTQPVQQTVDFTLRVFYKHIKRPANLPSYADFQFDSFEAMLDFYRVERRRRAYADRATSGEYRMNLTDHGRSVISECPYREQAHRDAIDGTWFKLQWRGPTKTV